jgi:hypothetical protein
MPRKPRPLFALRDARLDDPRQTDKLLEGFGDDLHLPERETAALGHETLRRIQERNTLSEEEAGVEIDSSA